MLRAVCADVRGERGLAVPLSRRPGYPFPFVGDERQITIGDFVFPACVGVVHRGVPRLFGPGRPGRTVSAENASL